MFIKNCPSCGDEISYKNKSSWYLSKKKSCTCKKCQSEKASKRMTGTKASDETKAKQSKLKLGKKLSEEHKINIGNSVRGLKRSEESKSRYSKSKLGDKNPTKREDVKEKIRNSVLELYKKHPEIKDKISISVKNYFENNPDYIHLNELDKYKKYRSIVNNLTRRVKKTLFEKWNGYDYYDNEYIKNNNNLNYNNKNYPTVDHKISIFDGFKQSILPEVIADINNLCITKRKLNIEKGSLHYLKFLEKLENPLI